MTPDPAFYEAIRDARIAELIRQRDALQSEVDSVAAHDPNTLARFGLYTGASMAAHAARVRANERARFTAAQQDDATQREREQDAADLAAFRARPALRDGRQSTRPALGMLPPYCQAL